MHDSTPLSHIPGFSTEHNLLSPLLNSLVVTVHGRGYPTLPVCILGKAGIPTLRDCSLLRIPSNWTGDGGWSQGEDVKLGEFKGNNNVLTRAKEQAYCTYR